MIVLYLHKSVERLNGISPQQGVVQHLDSESFQNFPGILFPLDPWETIFHVTRSSVPYFFTICIYIYTYMYICISVCIYIYMNGISIYLYLHICIYMYIYIYMYMVYIYINVYGMCLYIYLYVFISLFISIIQVSFPCSSGRCRAPTGSRPLPNGAGTPFFPGDFLLGEKSRYVG